MNAIVSVTSDWGIGKDGRLLVRNSQDMRHFKNTTMGGTVICGRTTFQSFPGGALQGRRNIVLSTDPSFSAKGAEVIRSVPQVLEATRNDDPNSVWVIGGQSIYKQLLNMCTHVIVTKNKVIVEADAYFPNLDDDPVWHIEDVWGEGVTKEGVPFEFVRYTRR